MLSMVLGLRFIAGLALLFGYLANKAFPRKTPNRRAAIAAGVLSVLVTSPAYIAIIAGGASLVALAAIPVGNIILAALCFPVALQATKLEPVQRDADTFD